MNCTDNHTMNLLHHLHGMFRVSGELKGLPIVAVSGHTEQALQCDDGLPRTFEALLMASIGVDVCGTPALRVKFIDSCDLAIQCSNNQNDPNALLNEMFAYDSTTKTYALVLNQST